MCNIVYNIHNRINTDIVRDMAGKDPQRKIADLDYESVDLPILPDDRSQFDVHCAIQDDKVKPLEYSCRNEYK
jgi:hypothetical protein